MAATAVPTTVTVARSDLARALRAAASIKAKHLLVDLASLEMSAYTSDVGVRVALDGERGDGSAWLPRPLLASLLAYCGPQLALSIDDEHLTIVSGESEFQVRHIRHDLAGTFDHDLDAEPESRFEIEAPVLAETLRRTLPFAGRDWTRPLLCAVAFFPADHCAVATDSYRLAVVRYGDEGDREDPILLSIDGAESVKRMLNKKLGTVEIGTTAKVHLIAHEDMRWSLRRPIGKYPNWPDLLPDKGDETAIVTIDREDLLQGSRAAGALAPRNTPLRLIVGKDGVSVTASYTEVGSMRRRLTSADAKGEEIEIGLNPGFVADICATAPVDRFAISLRAPLRPILVTAARDLYLLMPIRLNV